MNFFTPCTPVSVSTHLFSLLVSLSPSLYSGLSRHAISLFISSSLLSHLSYSPSPLSLSYSLSLSLLPLSFFPLSFPLTPFRCISPHPPSLMKTMHTTIPIPSCTSLPSKWNVPKCTKDIPVSNLCITKPSYLRPRNTELSFI